MLPEQRKVFPKPSIRQMCLITTLIPIILNQALPILPENYKADTDIDFSFLQF